jgi:hypothetical protein
MGDRRVPGGALEEGRGLQSKVNTGLGLWLVVLLVIASIATLNMRR